eukprot:TRINITY_DN14947_c0_g1_i1.p1 TRINITY_DN14947_c0_g1~~TRINITY_DN14947_c0_g1_i1.p1  ORF type:complete len:964 (-),score=256.90 TRINITY_DN14947_c0_g1_i1:90-2981(-)
MAHRKRPVNQEVVTGNNNYYPPTTNQPRPTPPNPNDVMIVNLQNLNAPRAGTPPTTQPPLTQPFYPGALPLPSNPIGFTPTYPTPAYNPNANPYQPSGPSIPPPRSGDAIPITPVNPHTSIAPPPPGATLPNGPSAQTLSNNSTPGATLYPSVPLHPNNPVGSDPRSRMEDEFGGGFSSRAGGPTGNPSFSFTPTPSHFEVPTPDPESQCPANYMRNTLNAIPDTSALQQKCTIPFGVIIQPLAEPDNYTVPVIDFSAVSKDGVIRCKQCRAYINPFVVFVDMGRRWRCNMCTYHNDCPPDYICDINPSNGQRLDKADRPELNRGCVEFVASKEYINGRPMAPSYVFVIDVSFTSITSGYFKTIVSTIAHSLDCLAADLGHNLATNNNEKSAAPGGGRVNFAIITFDSNIHFYNISSNLTQPRMLVVSDLENSEPFIPAPHDELLVNLSSSRSLIETLLEKLPTMHQDTTDVETCVGPAMKVAYELLRSVGGKVLLFNSKLSLKGAGIRANLTNREDPRVLGTEKEITLYKPSNKFYRELGLECSKQNICVDLFLMGTSYMDIITLSGMSQYSGGDIKWYKGFTHARDSQKLAQDLRRNLSRKTAWEAVMRLRCSAGVKTRRFFGNFFIKSSDLLSLPTIDPDKSISAQLEIEEPITKLKYITIQNALLYTTSFGERRIRVQNVCLPVTNDLRELYNSCDNDAIVSFIAKMGVDKGTEAKLSDVRSALLNKCIDVLTDYRTKYAPPQATPSQIIIPTPLFQYPLCTLGMLKNATFRGGITEVVLPDERIFLFNYVRSGTIVNIVGNMVPKLYQIYPGVEGNVKGLDGMGVSLVRQGLKATGMYVLDDKMDLYLWIGRGVAEGIKRDMFGVGYEKNETVTMGANGGGGEMGAYVNQVIGELRRRNGGVWQNVVVIRSGQDAAMEKKFYGKLIEDVIESCPSLSNYQVFLLDLQKKINEKSGVRT